MKVGIFDSHRYDRAALEEANRGRHELSFFEARLTSETAALAKGFEVVCCFVNDRLDVGVLEVLKDGGVGLVALRSAGFNHVDLRAAAALGLKVVRVPEYSPHAVAEHAVALLLTLNRKIHKAYNRVHELNFSLDGLVGFDLFGKTVGVFGTGRIGRVFSEIMKGFGCRVLACDAFPDVEWARSRGIEYVEREELFRQSDVISLHVPLTPETRHLLDRTAFAVMKKSAVVINTGRGALIDTKALIDVLKTHRLGGACLDVYEEEEGIFFSDLSETGIGDDLLARLLTFPNVIVTSHQAFLTREALGNIAETTMDNIDQFAAGGPLKNEVLPPQIR